MEPTGQGGAHEQVQQQSQEQQQQQHQQQQGLEQEHAPGGWQVAYDDTMQARYWWRMTDDYTLESRWDDPYERTNETEVLEEQQHRAGDLPPVTEPGSRGPGGRNSDRDRRHFRTPFAQRYK